METQVAEKSIAQRYECIGECVLVRRISDIDEFAAPGIIKPEIARQKSNRGEVIAIGEGRLIGGIWLPMGLSIGDTVHFSKYGGTEVDIDGKIYIKLHWKQIHLREICEG